MEKQKVKILETYRITHDVKCFRTEKPGDAEFEPGQATEVFLDDEAWRDEGRPFTFTCLPDDPYLEFMIKEYPDHKGVTREIHKLGVGDHFFVNDIFGEIHYDGEGLFIAGGAGITPFISIFRMLRKDGRLGKNRLLFANKTKADIILHDELKEILGNNLINVLSDESVEGYRSGLITREIIVDHIKRSDQRIYLCGPPPLMDAVHRHLDDLEIPRDTIIEEADE